jgi:hypothetical protein
LVEGEFSTFEESTVGATVLTGAGGDLGEDTTELELVFDGLLDLVAAVAECPLALQRGGSLVDVELAGTSGGSLLGLLGSLGGASLLLGGGSVDVDAVVLGVEELEGDGIDSDDGVLDEGLGTDELVAGGVVDDVEDAGGLDCGFGTPGEVAAVEAEGASLGVAATGADGGDALGAKLGVGREAAKFVLSALTGDGLLATGDLALVETAADDTHSFLLFFKLQNKRCFLFKRKTQ